MLEYVYNSRINTRHLVVISYVRFLSSKLCAQQRKYLPDRKLDLRMF